MTKRIIARNISVDSGTILITDAGNKKKSKLRGLGKIFSVENGRYHVEWFMDNTYNGNVSGSGHLVITSGRMLVIDPGYLYGDNYGLWTALLKKTNDLDNPPKNWIILNKHGGDGTFKVMIDLVKESD